LQINGSLASLSSKVLHVNDSWAIFLKKGFASTRLACLKGEKGFAALIYLLKKIANDCSLPCVDFNKKYPDMQRRKLEHFNPNINSMKFLNLILNIIQYEPYDYN
ncbi:MAG: hypothetical protein ACI93S_001605, partial [Ancylomarina sp.]